MSVGEKNFSTAGQTAVRFENKPPPACDYDGKLLTSNCEVGKKNEPGKLPYISKCMIELLGSAAAEGGKNRVVFHTFFLSLNPGSDGVAMPKRADQILGLARGIGLDCNLPTVEMRTYPGWDKDGNPKGDMVTVDVIDPRAALKWLQEQDGQIVRLHTKIRRSKGYPDQGTVDYFIETETQSAVIEDVDTGEYPEQADEAPPPPVRVVASKKAAKR